MLFTSYAFFGFAGALFLAYYLLPKRCQWPLLLAGSYLFYAASGPQFLPYLLASTAMTYAAGGPSAGTWSARAPTSRRTRRS